MRLIPFLVLLALSVTSACIAQRPPSTARLREIVAEWLSADEEGLAALREEVEATPSLSRAEARRWVAQVRRALVRGPGRKLESSGINYFYDERGKRGKYIVNGGPRGKGLVVGLHGGGTGSGDAGSAAGAWGGAIRSAGYIGLFPEVIEKKAAAWGEDVTVRFVMDLLAAAQRSFRFDADRVYVVGHSMGGYGAWTLSGRFPDRFAGAVSFAGSPTPLLMGGKVVGIQYAVLPNRRNLLTWCFHSADDPRVPIPPVRFAIEELSRLREADPDGYEFRYVEVDDNGHRFPPDGPTPALRWVMRRARDVRPRRVVWETFYREAGSRYWLDRSMKPQQGDRLVATHDGKGRFEITGNKGTRGVGVLMDDELCNLDREVTVVRSGAVAFEGKVERRLEILLECARRHRDPGLLFYARAPAAGE